MKNNTVIQYFEQARKGLSVNYAQGRYTIQNDKGWLHIVVNERGKRRKIDLKGILCEYGSFEDYVLNGWFEMYSDYETFKYFAENESLSYYRTT